MSRKLEGRVAWITGAGRGLGRAIALAYAEAGAELFLTARTADELEETAKAAQARGADVDWCTADVRSKAAVEAAHGRALERFGRIDVLVNNAGVWIEKPLLEFSDRLPRLFELERSYRDLWKFYVFADTADPALLKRVQALALEEFPGASNVYRIEDAN